MLQVAQITAEKVYLTEKLENMPLICRIESNMRLIVYNEKKMQNTIIALWAKLIKDIIHLICSCVHLNLIF